MHVLILKLFILDASSIIFSAQIFLDEIIQNADYISEKKIQVSFLANYVKIYKFRKYLNNFYRMISFVALFKVSIDKYIFFTNSEKVLISVDF